MQDAEKREKQIKYKKGPFKKSIALVRQLPILFCDTQLCPLNRIICICFTSACQFRVHSKNSSTCIMHNVYFRHLCILYLLYWNISKCSQPGSYSMFSPFLVLKIFKTVIVDDKKSRCRSEGIFLTKSFCLLCRLICYLLKWSKCPCDSQIKICI